MKIQTTMSHMPYLVLKKNSFKNNTDMYDEKNLGMSKYILDFRQLPTSLVSTFDELDKIWVLDKLINQLISEHTPMKQTKFTRTAAPWIKDVEIFNCKNILDNLRTESRYLNHLD